MEQIDFNVVIKKFPDKGNLAWEYNPFRNYRIDEDMIYYKGLLLTYLEFLDKYGNSTLEGTIEDKVKNLINTLPKTETPPVKYQKGLLVDFETDELNYDLNHPVTITPSYSYDDSVDLIINDGIHQPRLINSRFSAIGKDKYLIVDRRGINDTNIYDRGLLFDIDTSMYKRTTTIPELTFLGDTYGGKLKIGNYHFYFKYVDDDGNESDFIAESGLVSIFIGNTPESVQTGFRDLNSLKLIKFLISNTSAGYLKLLVYYTRSTADPNQNAVTSAYKILQEYPISNSQNATIVITGYEDTVQVSVDEINYQYLVYSGILTLAICLNRLFIANVTKPEFNHEDLQDCALRFIPKVSNTLKCDVNNLDNKYQGVLTNTYYNTNFIYDKVGYWDNEIYRFGIVFIMSDNTLSPVYNTTGYKFNNWNETPADYEFNIESRNYISWDPITYNIMSNSLKSSLQNAKGVIYFPDAKELTDVIGIGFTIKTEVLTYLKNKYNIKGFFFVRLNRIPSTICLAYTIGIERLSRTPVLPIGLNKYVSESFISEGVFGYTTLTDENNFRDREGHKLTHNFAELKRTIDGWTVRQQAAICPEYDVNREHLNSLFTGSKFVVIENIPNSYLVNSDRYFYTNNIATSINSSYNSTILGIEDNTKLMSIGDDKFAARAGEAEEAWRFSWLNSEVKEWDGGANIVRGIFGPYLAMTGYEKAGSIITIKVPGWNSQSLENLFSIRYNDNSAYHAISDRLSIDKFLENGNIGTFYRGDCYICKVTHRLNRNFTDPSTPTNDEIIDPFCWTDNIRFDDGVLNKEYLNDINLGDVNAVNLGMWVTFIVRSNMNLSVRSVDNSNVDEKQITGNGRGFYPYHPMIAESAYKMPESQCYNKGFTEGLSEKMYMNLGDTPAYRNNYSTRIAYSNVRVNTFFENSFRTFKGLNYTDYPMTYGAITKLIEFKGSLICVLEHGIYKINVQERTLAADGSNPVYINTLNVLPENPLVISDTFGSLWGDSIIKTDAYIYGVDTVGKKIWRTDGNLFFIISDMRVSKFLNENISLKEREKDPIIGIRNVKTHYNHYKHDVMFTFYDNLEGFNEKVWNLCWNEYFQNWITFYSWIPSFSENIYNMYFSFNRDTSKWISKLGNDQYVSLDKVIFDSEDELLTEFDYDSLLNSNLPKPRTLNKIGKLSLSGIDSQIKYQVKYTLERDNFQNYKYFRIIKEGDEYYLCRTKSYVDYCTERFERNYGIQDLGIDYYKNRKDKSILYIALWCGLKLYSTDLESIKALLNRSYKEGLEYLLNFACPVNIDDYEPITLDYDEDNEETWESFVNTGSYKCATDKKGARILIDKNDPRWKDRKIVYLLNIRANLSLETGTVPSVQEAYASSKSYINDGIYELVVTVIPEYNMLFLSTDFWKHGRAGLIDIQDPIEPTKWYGEQHPFEFEFVVNDNIDKHKIFNNLQIISNNAEPESFHYEIIGDAYEFANDKINMYIRQEATKELYLYNGANITYNNDYKTLNGKQRPIIDDNDSRKRYYDKSTILPLNYFREDTIDAIYDSYIHKNDEKIVGHDYRNLAGGELKYDYDLNLISIINHCLALDVSKSNILRGNMRYKEDLWYVQMNPLEIILKNERKWNKVPYEIHYFPPTKETLFDESGNPKDSLTIPPYEQDRMVEVWNENNSKRSLTKLKDKFIKIRIRYKGNKLAIIRAVYTLYTLSYS